MSCSPETLKDYLLGELSAAEEKTLQHHLTACGHCQEEWQRLQITRTALLAVPDEEPVRRTAFVSDQVFAPTWWQRLWRSGPQLGFVSAGLLTLAILAHGILGRSATPVTVHATQGASAAMVQAQVEKEVEKRLRPLIAQAVAESEARVTRRNAEIVHAALLEAEHRMQSSRRVEMARAQEAWEYVQARLNTDLVTRNNNASHGEGE